MGKQGKNKSDGIPEIFGKEFRKMESYQKLLENDAITQEELKDALTRLLADYNILLRDTMKITRLGDSTQHKLLMAKEKIEDLNEKLVESERNIRELNTILMFYIKATDKY